MRKKKKWKIRIGAFLCSLLIIGTICPDESAWIAAAERQQIEDLFPAQSGSPGNPSEEVRSEEVRSEGAASEGVASEEETSEDISEEAASTEGTAAENPVTEVSETAVFVQEQIDQLPSPECYDYLDFAEKDAALEKASHISDAYFYGLAEEERKQVDAADLFALDMYGHTYAFYQSEEQYEGQLTMDDIDRNRISAGELSVLQQQIQELPEVMDLVGEGPSYQDTSRLEHPNLGLAGDEVSFRKLTEEGEGLFYSDTQMDQLYQEVLDAAETFYALPKDQAQSLDSGKLTGLAAFYSVGVSTYASSAKIGRITSYSNPTYQGTMAPTHMRYGYYEVSTNQSEGDRVAFCMDSKASTPGGEGTSLYKEAEVTSKVIRTILYYGYGGPGEVVSHDMNGYCETHMAICYAVDGTSCNNTLARAAYQKLYTEAADPDAWESVQAWAVGTGVSGTQTLVYAIYHSAQNGSLIITKSGQGGEPLEGVEFRLFPEGDAQTDAAICRTTDASGRACWEDLTPGSYLLQETKTLPGYTSLTEPVKILIPQEGGEAPVYDVSYRITNGPDFVLPMTGAVPWKDAAKAAGGSFCLGLSGVLVFLQKGKIKIR